MDATEMLGRRPLHVVAVEAFEPWFAELADTFLNKVELVVSGAVYRFAEIEMYYHGSGHLDPFTHREPLQQETGRWYFHRSRGSYRGGSFKGLDLTLGDGIAYFGILIRSVVDASGVLHDGPCVTVDLLLQQTTAKNVASLDARIGARRIQDPTSPLSLRVSERERTAAIFRSARVGLSLKKAVGDPSSTKFVGQPYRFLTEPRLISKGKAHVVVGLYERGESRESITKLTGCPRKAVQRYINDYEAGRDRQDFTVYLGKDLNTAEQCKLLGTWAGRLGKPQAGGYLNA